ncbi:WYL domain-containing protein [Labilibaculum sp. K2S]|uniref:helix-turn-helix transcriptional regulator n=1 Tax=Labilibaculum sp. K2S TaxID=3056386 RepID=UPI0025A327CF|nr:WYL domain-containing protein [Labilibaculum sp. K2S]MDM8161481.1 WYL domain-containing protein [Labilibaculum sp. K2S]
MRKKTIPGFRHEVIDTCLCNPFKNWTKDRLIEKINEKLMDCHGIDGICEKTFYNDIRNMKSEPPRGYDAPIECMNGAYIYTESDFTIQKDNLSDEDIESINKAIEVLSQFKQIGIHTELSSVKEKILGYKSNIDEVEHLIEFEQQEVKGMEFLSSLYPLIKEKKVIKIEYQSFRSSEPHEYIVHPYYLKQYKHRWYLVCYCESHEMIATYALDRFINITEIFDVNFREVEYKALKKRFENIIGVTKIVDHVLQQIEVWISKELAPYIETKKIHHSQVKLNEDDKGIVIALTLIPNYEFYSIIQSFGNSIEILSPVLVRDELALKLESASKMYHAPVGL